MFAIVAVPFPVRNAERNTDPWRSAVIDASLSRLQENLRPAWLSVRIPDESENARGLDEGRL